MSVNKVELGNRTLIDLTEDTVSANNLLTGATAHNAAGEQIHGLVPPMEVDSELSDTSTNPVQNKKVKEALDGKQAKSTAVTHAASTAAGSETNPVYVNASGVATACKYSLNKTVPSDAKFTDTTYSNMTGATSSAAGAAGLVPAPATGKQASFLRGDGTWVVPTDTTYSNMTGATSSAAGKAGLVPAPAAGKQASFLRGDGTWVVPDNTTYSNMTAATASAAGKAGLVPAPAAGKQASFLRGDGTWVVPTDTTYSTVSKSAAGLCPALPNETTTTKYLRQDGSWVAPPNTTYSAVSKTAAGLCPALPNETTTTKYLRQDGSWVTPPDTTYSNMTAATASAAGKAGLVPAPAAGKQASFLRGDGTWVVPTDTTYSNMTGATSSAAGKAGLVPAPAAGKQASFLRGDGTWVVPTDTTYSTVSKSAAGLCPALPNETTTTKYLRQDGSWVVPPNTTYSNMTGATTSAAGAAGLVPAPPKISSGSAGALNYYLKSDGTWATDVVSFSGGQVGAPTIPVYVNAYGRVVSCTYSLNKTVPSDAVFTDTNTWRPLGTGATDAAAGNHTHSYLPLAGGTMTGDVTLNSGLRIGQSTGNLFLGNSGNAGWVYVQDMASQASTCGWKLHQAGSMEILYNLTVGTMTAQSTYKLGVNGSINGTTLYENGTALSSKYLGISATASSATTEKITFTDPTTGTLYKVPFVSDSATDASNTGLCVNDGLKYLTYNDQGAGNYGYGVLYVGNSTSVGTAKNKVGMLRLYGKKSGYVDLRGDGLTNTGTYVVNFNAGINGRTVNFPDDSGNLMVTDGLKTATWKVTSNPGTNQEVTNRISISNPGVYLISLYTPYLEHTGRVAFSVRDVTNGQTLNNCYVEAFQESYIHMTILWTKSDSKTINIAGVSSAGGSSATFQANVDYWDRGGLRVMKLCSTGLS